MFLCSVLLHPGIYCQIQALVWLEEKKLQIVYFLNSKTPDSSTLNNKGLICELNQTFLLFTIISLKSYTSLKKFLLPFQIIIL